MATHSKRLIEYVLNFTGEMGRCLNGYTWQSIDGTIAVHATTDISTQKSHVNGEEHSHTQTHFRYTIDISTHIHVGRYTIRVFNILWWNHENMSPFRLFLFLFRLPSIDCS